MGPLLPSGCRKRMTRRERTRLGHAIEDGREVSLSGWFVMARSVASERFGPCSVGDRLMVGQDNGRRRHRTLVHSKIKAWHYKPCAMSRRPKTPARSRNFFEMRLPRRWDRESSAAAGGKTFRMRRWPGSYGGASNCSVSRAARSGRTAARMAPADLPFRMRRSSMAFRSGIRSRLAAASSAGIDS